jgi:hypothetical protein
MQRNVTKGNDRMVLSKPPRPPRVTPAVRASQVLGERVPIKSEKTRICLIRANQVLAEIG